MDWGLSYAEVWLCLAQWVYKSQRIHSVDLESHEVLLMDHENGTTALMRKKEYILLNTEVMLAAIKSKIK